MTFLLLSMNYWTVAMILKKMHLCLTTSEMPDIGWHFHVVKMWCSCHFFNLLFSSLYVVLYTITLHSHYMDILCELKNKRLRTNQKSSLFFTLLSPRTYHINILFLFLEKVRFLTSTTISIFALIVFSVLSVEPGK